MSEFYQFENKALSEIDILQAQVEDHSMKLDFLLNVDIPAENISTFSSAGTFTWTCPEGIFKVCALIQGGGKGASAYAFGAGSTSSTGSSANNIGLPETDSGKAIMIYNIPVTPGTKYTIKVGKAGGRASYPDFPGDWQMAVNEGTLGGESSAFGYSSDDSSKFLYQYYTTVSPVYGTAQQATAVSEAVPSLRGTINNKYESSGSYGYRNGAPGYFFSNYKVGFIGYQDSAKDGIVKIYY